MAPDRLPRFSQRNVLAAINRPVIAPGRMWGICGHIRFLNLVDGRCGHI
jgi:hypothetical protein